MADIEQIEPYWGASEFRDLKINVNVEGQNQLRTCGRAGLNENLAKRHISNWTAAARKGYLIGYSEQQNYVSAAARFEQHEPTMSYWR